MDHIAYLTVRQLFKDSYWLPANHWLTLVKLLPGSFLNKIILFRIELVAYDVHIMTEQTGTPLNHKDAITIYRNVEAFTACEEITTNARCHATRLITADSLRRHLFMKIANCRHVVLYSGIVSIHNCKIPVQQPQSKPHMMQANTPWSANLFNNPIVQIPQITRIETQTAAFEQLKSYHIIIIIIIIINVRQ